MTQLSDAMMQSAGAKEMSTEEVFAAENARKYTVIETPKGSVIDWLWYGVDENGGQHLSFGRWQKHPCQHKFIVKGPELNNLVATAGVLERSVANMRNPQNVAEAAMLVHVTVGPALKQAKEAIAAYKEKFGV